MAQIQGRLGRLLVSDDGGSTFVDVGCLVDMTLNGNQEELDTTCHSDGQFRTYLPGRKDATIDGTLNWDKDDAGQSKIKAAFFSNTSLQAKFRMQELASADEFISSAIVTSFTPASPNDDVATVDFTLRLSGDFTNSAQP